MKNGSRRGSKYVTMSVKGAITKPFRNNNLHIRATMLLKIKGNLMEATILLKTMQLILGHRRSKRSSSSEGVKESRSCRMLFWKMDPLTRFSRDCGIATLFPKEARAVVLIWCVEVDRVHCQPCGKALGLGDVTAALEAERPSTNDNRPRGSDWLCASIRGS